MKGKPFTVAPKFHADWSLSILQPHLVPLSPALTVAVTLAIRQCLKMPRSVLPQQGESGFEGVVLEATVRG